MTCHISHNYWTTKYEQKAKKQMQSITQIILIAVNGLMGSVLMLMCVCERLQMPVWQQDLNWWIGLDCIYLEFTKDVHTSALSPLSQLWWSPLVHICFLFLSSHLFICRKNNTIFFSSLGADKQNVIKKWMEEWNFFDSCAHISIVN